MPGEERLSEDSHHNSKGDPVAQAAAHLQSASRSMIAAVRAFVDAAEALIETPGVFTSRSQATSGDSEQPVEADSSDDATRREQA